MDACDSGGSPFPERSIAELGEQFSGRPTNRQNESVSTAPLRGVCGFVDSFRDRREGVLDRVRYASYTRIVDMPAPPPTDAELNVLKVLWQQGPSTVRNVHEELYRNTEVGYTTTLKLLQNMFAKRLVKRNEEQRQHVYSAAVSEQRTLNDLVRRWVDGTFAGSPAALAMRAFDLKRVTREELAALKALVSRLEERERGQG